MAQDVYVFNQNNPPIVTDNGFTVPEISGVQLHHIMTVNLSAGTYRFTVTTDDGVRVWVDNTLVINKWQDQASTTTMVDVALGAGSHTVKMEYYENAGQAVAKLSYVLAPSTK